MNTLPCLKKCDFDEMHQTRPLPLVTHIRISSIMRYDWVGIVGKSHAPHCWLGLSLFNARGADCCKDKGIKKKNDNKYPNVKPDPVYPGVNSASSAVKRFMERKASLYQCQDIKA